MMVSIILVTISTLLCEIYFRYERKRSGDEVVNVLVSESDCPEHEFPHLADFPASEIANEGSLSNLFRTSLCQDFLNLIFKRTKLIYSL